MRGLFFFFSYSFPPLEGIFFFAGCFSSAPGFLFLRYYGAVSSFSLSASFGPNSSPLAGRKSWWMFVGFLFFFFPPLCIFFPFSVSLFSRWLAKRRIRERKKRPPFFFFFFFFLLFVFLVSAGVPDPKNFERSAISAVLFPFFPPSFFPSLLLLLIPSFFFAGRK